MGLPVPWLRLIIREHKQEPFNGRVLTLGRLAVLTTYNKTQNIFKEEGVDYHPLDDDMDTSTNIPRFKRNNDKYSRFTSDIVFFKLLGVDSIETMDVSNYEHADIIHDLNTKVPKKLEERYDAIFDFGTTEHIFNTKQVLDNYNLMLKPNGRILHGLPTSNRIGHGFYMFSPELFYDYYLANKFVDAHAYLVENNRGDPSFVKWKLFDYKYETYKNILSSYKSVNGIGTFFSAKKTAQSTIGVIPQQGQFKNKHKSSRSNLELSDNKKYIADLKKYTPKIIKSFYHILLKFIIQFKNFFKSRAEKAGLKYLGKI